MSIELRETFPTMNEVLDYLDEAAYVYNHIGQKYNEELGLMRDSESNNNRLVYTVTLIIFDEHKREY